MAVLGLGLIGGSLARALTAAGYRVVGHDRGPSGRAARRAGAVAALAPSVREAVAGADLVVLAAPPRANRALLSRVTRWAPQAAITDVGSVKSPIVRTAEDLGLRRFVGGHPMAGAAHSGFAASRADLFRGGAWILTPTRRAAPEALAAVLRLARAVGARPVVLDAATHDRIMAFLSHVPQLVAWALRDAAQSDGLAARHLALAGPGFRDMTRLAKSPAPLWREVLGDNRAEVRRALAAFRRALGRRV